MATDYKLTYFNGRGRGEIIRLVLTAAGVPFEDKRIDISDWPTAKPKLGLIFNQIPIFEFGDVKMCQSLAIARHLARKYNLAGKSDLDQARADMIIDCIEDAVLQPVPRWSRHEKDAARKEELRKAYMEKLPDYLDKLQAILVSNNGGNGYFVGDSLTWADLHLVVANGYLELMAGLKDPLAKHPKLNELHKRVLEHPKVVQYMTNIPKTDF